jgi:hypothetical protein
MGDICGGNHSDRCSDSPVHSLGIVSKMRERQPELFAEYRDKDVYARGSDPDTSHEAAGAMSKKRATALENKVLRAIRASMVGLTSHEIVAATGLDWNTCTPRIRPLVRKGWVVDTGLRKVGPAGRNCIIWKAV